jgi:hypothetical protein
MGLLPKVAAFAALMLCSGPAQAQAPGPRTIELSAKAGFRHRHSKIELPPVLAGLPRTKATEYEADQLDIISEYASSDLGEAYTVYIYRNVAGGLPVWFDRARWMMERRGDLGAATLHSSGQFVPPGRTSASGLLATYAVTGKGYRSTGVALVPAGEWLVKIRASSATLSPDQLDSKVKSVLAQIGWPKKMDPAPAAVPVAACVSALALSGDAKPAAKDEDSLAESLMGALVGMAAASQEPAKRAEPRPAPKWCRDSAELAEAGIYRADEQKDGYFLALADAGRGVGVGRSAGHLLHEGTDDKKARPEKYEVQTILLSQTLTSGLLDRLPPPAQALAIAKEGRFASSFGTWGKGKGQIGIAEDALK